ncbi:hypothetical protein JCM8547_006363 [Rhodosporidiobolus lusitaniae]
MSATSSTALKLQQPGAAARIALASYLACLDRSPVATKACTSGFLYLVSELVSSAVASRSLPPSLRVKKNVQGVRSKEDKGYSPLALLKRYQQALKLAAYGFFVAAPLDHYLYCIHERVFAGRTGKKARILEVVAANTLILPIQNAIYLAVLSVLGGARSLSAIGREVKAGFVEVMKLTVVISTGSLVVAQRFLPPSAWTPFFSLIAATLDTYINIQEKKRAAVEAEKRSLKDKAARGKDE